MGLNVKFGDLKAGEYQVTLNNENEVELKLDLKLSENQVIMGHYEHDYANVRCLFKLSINRYRMRIFW